jgi:hypothetical protein
MTINFRLLPFTATVLLVLVGDNGGSDQVPIQSPSAQRLSGCEAAYAAFYESDLAKALGGAQFGSVIPPVDCHSPPPRRRPEPPSGK